MKKLTRVVLVNDDGSETEALKYMKHLCNLTKISPHKLLQHNPEGKPKGLIAEKIIPCLDGKRKTLREDYYHFVVLKWEGAVKQKRGGSAHQKVSVSGVSVSITPEIKEELNKFFRETGVSVLELLKSSGDQVPKGLHSGKVKSWMNGELKVAHEGHLIFVLGTIKKWKNKQCQADTACDEFLEMESCLMTPDIIAELESYIEVTKCSPTILLKDSVQSVPDGFSARNIRSWLSGKVQKVPLDQLNFVRQEWKQRAGKINQKKRPKLKIAYLVNEQGLPTDTLIELRELHRKTCVSPEALLKRCDNIPEGLTAGMVRGWISGSTVKTNQSYVDFVLSRLRPLPETSFVRLLNDDKTPNDLLLELRDLRDRSYVPFSRLLKGCDHVPDGLSYGMVENWLTGYTEKAKQHHVDFVRRLWRSSPMKKKSKM